MKDRVFFDSNIIIYLFDKSEKDKYELVKYLFYKNLQENISYISTQVINEFIVIASQKIKSPLSLEEIKKRIDFLNTVLNINIIGLNTCYKAVDLRLRHKYSYWDSLIIASALENDCSILYTEDLQHEQMIEGKLKIINPFEKQG